MPVELEFGLAPERLDEGSPEERAAFGLFSVRTGQQSLTEGFDHYLNGFRPGPLVSGYHVAEWLTWNWWRLRWEPRSAAPDWSFAHRMTSIGEGYVWPNLEIWSDGVRTMLISHPSSRPDAKPFRYVGAAPTVVPSRLFEAAIDEFLPRVIGRLREEKIFSETNLDRLWRDVLIERADPEIAKRRRLEALMGRDADAVEDGAVEALLADSARLGESAVGEVAAERARTSANGSAWLTAKGLEAIAAAIGHAASSRDTLALDPNERLPRHADVPAWKLGAQAADAVRRQERLAGSALSNERLAQMAGTAPTTLTELRADAIMSYALDDPTGSGSRIVLPGRRETARRFALARVVGDRLIHHSGALHPATHAYTYRQKAQRAFAAELLAPFEAIEEMLAGDYSEDKQQDVADYFSVSPMVVNTLLKNHGRIERDQPEEDVFAAAA